MQLSFVTTILILATSGCATTATLQRAAGPSIDSEIVDGDTEYIYVENEAGLVYKVPRRDVADVDHPGNVLAVVGIVLTGMAAILAVEMENKNDRWPLATIYGVPGVLMTGYGTTVWWQSRRRHRTRKRRTHGAAALVSLPQLSPATAALPATAPNKTRTEAQPISGR